MLEAHGFTGQRLLKLAHKVAGDTLRSQGGVPGSRFEDLVAFLVVEGCKAALRYDPKRTQRLYGRNGGDPFASWLADILTRRVFDWFRQKGEGFADHRHAYNVVSIEHAGDRIGTLKAIHGDAGELLVENADQDLEAAIARLSDDLSEDALWALQRVAAPMTAGLSEWQAVREATGGGKGSFTVARQRMERLREELAARVEAGEIA